jgi:hypothetical protein
MPADWRVEFWPECAAHAFLSHCAEDRPGLVLPVFDELQRRRLIPWIDRHHFPQGRDAFEVMREELLRSRHVVYFITPAMLRQGRGWTHVERCLAEVIQRRLVYGSNEVAHVELPLLFVHPTERLLQRSFYHALQPKWLTCPHDTDVSLRNRLLRDDGTRAWTERHVMWAADCIEAFVNQEQAWAWDLAIRFGQDSAIDRHFADDPCRRRRILGETPLSLPSQ